VATNVLSVARSPILGMSNSVSTWMGDYQGRPDAVNQDPFIGVDMATHNVCKNVRQKVDQSIENEKTSS